MSEFQHRAIRECVEEASPGSARRLISIYRESEWRTIRLEVIRALGRFRDLRSFPFLVELVKRNRDLAEQDLALISLARQKTRAARFFLLSYYRQVPETLRPRAAYALGVAGVREAGDLLLRDLIDPRFRQNPVMLKNLVLALGELREARALPVLHDLLATDLARERDFLPAFLYALGNLERDPARIRQHESKFLDDSLLWQAYQSALSQIEARGAGPDKKTEDGTADLEVPEGADRDGFLLFLLDLAGRGELFRTAADAARVRAAIPAIESDSELRLAWINAFLPVVDFPAEAKTLLVCGDPALEIGFLNLWSERAIAEENSRVRSAMSSFLKLPLRDETCSRLLRACVETGVRVPEIEEGVAIPFQSAGRRKALLSYCTRFAHEGLLPSVFALPKTESEELSPAILRYLDSLALSGKLPRGFQNLESFLDRSWSGGHETGVLRILRSLPFPSFEARVESAIRSADHAIALQAVIAAKAFPASRLISEALADRLEGAPEVIRGRALDSVLAHKTLTAKRAAMRFLQEHSVDDFIVDKIFRDFDPERTGGEEFFQAVASVLEAHPDHPQWEKLLSLRDRLRPAATADAAGESPEISRRLDEHLEGVISRFASLDLSAKLALRAAEQPFLAGAPVGLPVDNAPTVLEYCKALDLILDKQLGQNHLFPRLDRGLHEFQALWQKVGLGEDSPRSERVIERLGLRGRIEPENFPLHKAKLMSGNFFNGRILQDRFKIFDGLRAWAVIFLFFTRRIPDSRGLREPVLKLPGLTDTKALEISVRLMRLQDLRNPAAHRQTYPRLDAVRAIRDDAVSLINAILDSVS